MDFLILWGSNPAISKMSFTSLARPEARLRGITERGGRVILIDPRKTETARLLGEHLFIRPDTDIFLMLAMLQVIFSEDLYDKSFVARHTKGLEALKSLAREYPPEKAAKVTGITAAKIKKLARDFATAEKAGIHVSLGVNLGSMGSLGYWLAQCLNAVTGCLDKDGAMLFLKSLANFPRLYQWANRNRKQSLSRIGGYASAMDTMPGGIMADEILTRGPGQIRALIVASGNPLLTVPDTDKLEKAFQGLDFMVSLDLYINETGAMADYILPSKDFYEHWDFAFTAQMFNPMRHLNYTDAVVEAEGERKELWVLLHEVLQAAGYPLAGIPFTGPLTRALDRAGQLLGRETPVSVNPHLMLRALLAAGGVSFKKLKKSGRGLVMPPHESGDFFTKLIVTRDKKMDLAPADFIAEKGNLAAFFEKEKKYKGLKLIGMRRKRTHNSWFHNVRSFVEKTRTNHAYLNTKDAKKLAVSEGDPVSVKSANGEIRLSAKLTDTLMPGVVSIPHGWGHDHPSGLSNAKKYPGINVNRLMSSGPGNLEKFAGQAILTGIRVTVEKVK